MLNAIEIVELEKKVFQYRLKQRLHYLVFTALLFLIALIGVFLYPTFVAFIYPNEKISITIPQPVEANVSSLDSNVSFNSLETNTTVKYIPTNANVQKTDETLFLQLPIISKNSPEKKEQYLPEPIEKKKSFGIQEEELDNRVATRKMPGSIEDESFYRSKEEKIDTALLPPPLLEEPKQKGVIKIETHEVNSIQYLKDKFDKTHNITFALMLAEEYYLAKNYNESNKWALIANNTDSENEKSWIWFAKSKIKLGHKEDAALALKAYLKNNKSQAAQSLLNQINVGEVID
jgi:hypothetical protein